MKVRSFIVPIFSVNVVDDLSWLSADDFPVFPFAAAALRPVAKTERFKILGERAVGFFHACASDRNGNREFGNGTDHFVITSDVRAVGHILVLTLVGVEWIAMFLFHLIVAIAHIPRDGGALAMDARSANDLSTPSVFRRAVALDALVMHQAEAVRGVFSSATLNRAKRHEHSRFWLNVYSSWEAPNQALGNSWAVPVVAWITRRLTAALELA